MLPDPANCTRRVGAACKSDARATASTTPCHSQPSSTHSTSSTSTSLRRAAVDLSHQSSTGSTTQRPLVTERRVFIPSVRRPENDQGCNLKLKAAVVNGYRPYQLTAAETDNRPDQKDVQRSQSDRATLCVN